MQCFLSVAPPEGVEARGMFVFLGDAWGEGGEALGEGEEGPALFVQTGHAGDGEETEAMLPKGLLGY